MVTDEVEVIIAPSPDLLVSVSNAQCFGDENGSIVVQNIAGIEAQSVQWSNGEVGEVLENVGAGQYDFVFTDTNGCSAEGTAIVSQPQAIVLDTFVIDAQDGEGGTIVVFAAGAVNPLVITVNGEIITGGIANDLPPGVYEIVVTDAQGCTNSTKVEVQNIVTVGEFERTDAVLFYPNPAHDRVHIQLNQQATRVVVAFYDLTGRMIDTAEHRNTQYFTRAFDLPAGTYFVHVSADQLDQAFKLVVR